MRKAIANASSRTEHSNRKGMAQLAAISKKSAEAHQREEEARQARNAQMQNTIQSMATKVDTQGAAVQLQNLAQLHEAHAEQQAKDDAARLKGNLALARAIDVRRRPASARHGGDPHR